jgi:hypothetical protein
MNDGVLGSWTVGGEQAHTLDHPPIIRTGLVKAANGAYAAGLVLMRDGTDLLIPWDGVGIVAGVCNVPCDTATETSCAYVAHGTVKAGLLTKAASAALVTADLRALETHGIYAV